MANYYVIYDDQTLPTDGNQVTLTGDVILRRDESGVPDAIALGAGDYMILRADAPLELTVDALSAGTIVQTDPTIGDTLTRTGSNASPSATFNWQIGGVDFDPAVTTENIDTTGRAAGSYTGGVADGVQTMVYTPAVTVGAAASSTQPAVLGTGGVLSGTVAAGETFTDALPSAGNYFVLIAVLNNGPSAQNIALTAELGTVTDLAGDGQNGGDTTIGFWHVNATAQSDISFTVDASIFNGTRVFILDANDASSTLRTSEYKQLRDQSGAANSIAQVLTGLTLGDFVVTMCAQRNDTPTHTWGGDMATGEITTAGFSAHRYSLCVQTVDATNDSPDNFDISVTAATLDSRVSLGTFVAMPT